ncbi:MAG: hypothetical protein JNK40_02805 [Chromatiales bacterium]|nr:hypothetical protein [Chromatiales bacterium]
MTSQLHPYVVHFSVGLILLGVVLFWVGTLAGSRPWAADLLTAARWNLWIGSPLALVSIGSGFVDYIAAQCDADAVAATILHRRSGAVTWWSSLIAAIAVYRTRHRAPGPLLLAWLLLVGVAAATAAALGTGLTYDRAVGVHGAWPADTGRCFELERSPPL